MIYDCILYNGEKDLLEIRLNEMSLCNDWVTTIIVEANKTHTGWEKPLYFEEHKKYFEKHKNIMYFVVDDMPNGIPMGIGTPSNSGKVGPEIPNLLLMIFIRPVLKAKCGVSKLHVVNRAFLAYTTLSLIFFKDRAFTKISPS